MLNRTLIAPMLRRQKIFARAIERWFPQSYSYASPTPIYSARPCPIFRSRDSKWKAAQALMKTNWCSSLSKVCRPWVPGSFGQTIKNLAASSRFPCIRRFSIMSFPRFGGAKLANNASNRESVLIFPKGIRKSFHDGKIKGRSF